MRRRLILQRLANSHLVQLWGRIIIQTNHHPPGRSNQYSPWPELPVPPENRTCNKCDLVNQRNRLIWGEGNPRSSIVFILDNPGAREDKTGKPFVYGTRMALRQAIQQSGLDPDQILVTYLLKCRPIRAYDKEKSRRACLPYLKQQLSEVKPRFLICMGNVVLQTLYAGEAEVKNYRGRWMQIMGFPALVTYHPLAARRRPNLLKCIVNDLTLAAQAVAKVDE